MIFLKICSILVVTLFVCVCIGGDATEPINVGIIFTKAATNENLRNKFRTCVLSILKYARVDINFYIIGDAESQAIAKRTFARVRNLSIKYELKPVDADDLARKMHALVAKMQKHFSHSPSSYYGDSLFFLSIGLVKVFDPAIKRMILLDSDLKFKEDIGQLHALFDKFSATNIIGIARDAQPVYRHNLWKYRHDHPSTRVGDPPPHGITGFNSGVLLMDLERMRHSRLYHNLIRPDTVEKLTEKYSFRGHLGDQDFFSLISFEHQELFYVLPCTWNRQLCTWWMSGYPDVFDQYFRCDEREHGKVKVYHGNCNTPIPTDEDDAEFATSVNFNFIDPNDDKQDL